MIADSHCHAWRHWPYHTGVPDPEHRGSVEALLWEMDRHHVEHAAVVCAAIGAGRGGDGFANEDNNDYVVAAARLHPDRLTAWVDVDSVWWPDHHAPGSASRLAAELDRTGATGVTHYVGASNDGWLRSREGRDFLAVAAERGVVVSLAAGAAWLPDLIETCRAQPAPVVLLHHLGQPRRGPHREADISAVLACAEVPTIAIKASGFHYDAEPGWDFPYRVSLPLLGRLQSAFGPHRLLWGSDFPAARDLVTYRQSIEIVREHSGLAPADQQRVLGGNLLHLLQHGSLPGASV